MKNYGCTKCGSTDVFIDNRGNQKALMCGDCGAWLKWIGKKELPLIERFIENNNVEDSRISTFEIKLSEEIQKFNLSKNEVDKIVEKIYKMKEV